jgi:hypothetical protein
MFAKELPEAKKHRAKDVNQVHVNSQIDPSDELLKQKNVGQLSKAVWVSQFSGEYLTIINCTEYFAQSNICGRNGHWQF